MLCVIFFFLFAVCANHCVSTYLYYSHLSWDIMFIIRQCVIDLPHYISPPYVPHTCTARVRKMLCARALCVCIAAGHAIREELAS